MSKNNQAGMSNEKLHVVLFCPLALDLCHFFVI